MINYSSNLSFLIGGFKISKAQTSPNSQSNIKNQTGPEKPRHDQMSQDELRQALKGLERP
jgi:hypothetical protein